MCMYRGKQDLINLNLHSVSFNKILVLEFFSAKVSLNLNLSTKQMNRVQFIRTEIFKWKYNQVKLVLSVFASTKIISTYIEQARCNQ